MDNALFYFLVHISVENHQKYNLHIPDIYSHDKVCGKQNTVNVHDLTA